MLRGPEAGLVMVRGRTGGGGAPFNLGEMTATRCTVRTDAGFVGHAYVAGRNERLAELAALADALLQDPDAQSRVAGRRSSNRWPRRSRRRRDAVGGEGGGDARAVLRHAEHALMSATRRAARLRRSGRRGAGDIPRGARCDGAAGHGCIRSGERLTAPAPLDPATAAVLLTLVDNETPLWLDPAVAAARDWLAFHCGASIVDAPERRCVRAWHCRCPI